ncbi:hypothetical protein JFL43_02450 [Viridibacillus sp. YIM B01967]|uniref:Uncharacterized protein n=1 Tax=Viridibacillus soli TaxID=2798301 RepID=A0ABS1H2W6_9BACL|nr:hypothetical protein [Viridibacillus soli]MBK3493736.1 hypothetical protein [Viridibacillus soli]
MSAFLHFQGVLTELHETPTYFALTCQKQDHDDIIILNIAKETLLFNSTTYESLQASDLKPGFFIHAYVHKHQPATRIFPPQISPTLVVANEKDLFYGVKVGTYNAATSLIETDLRLNIGPNTKMLAEAGQNIEAEQLDGHDIAVFFKMSTRSIPPRTTPNMIILLDD